MYTNLCVNVCFIISLCNTDYFINPPTHKQIKHNTDTNAVFNKKLSLSGIAVISDLKCESDN